MPLIEAERFDFLSTESVMPEAPTAAEGLNLCATRHRRKRFGGRLPASEASTRRADMAPIA